MRTLRPFNSYITAIGKTIVVTNKGKTIFFSPDRSSCMRWYYCGNTIRSVNSVFNPTYAEVTSGTDLRPSLMETTACISTAVERILQFEDQNDYWIAVTHETQEGVISLAPH